MNLLIIDPIITNALKEDLTWGDVTSEFLIDPSYSSELVLLQKEQGVVAGLTVAERTFKLVDPTVVWQSLVNDGQFNSAGTALAKIRGKSRNLLMAERVALNFLQRMSGIATLTQRFVSVIKTASTHTRLLDTRKTTPGLRYLEKYAVRMGGGFNHRYNLSDSVLIKDNHLAILTAHGKSVPDAIALLRESVPHTVKIEVEVDTLDQLEQFQDLGIDTFLLDNMTYAQLAAAVNMLKGKAQLEASGGITLENVSDVAATGVDFISVGALTHSAKALDISLDFL